MRWAMTTAAALAVLAAATAPLEAQLGDRVRQRTRQQVERRVERTAERAVEDALDRTEEGIRCAATDRACIQEAEARGETVILTDAPAAATPAAAAPRGAGPAARPGEGAWVNYDFVPGDRIVFADDFSTDRVGDFPRRLELQQGNMEVAEWNGRRWLRSTSPSRYNIPLPEALPERFTIEFDAVVASGWSGQLRAYVPGASSDAHSNLVFSLDEAGVQTRGGASARARPAQRPADGIIRFRAMVDGPYIKVYHGDTRVANVPNADFPRTRVLQIEYNAADGYEAMIGNLRIAESRRAPLHDAIRETGRVATHGILFDSGSDALRPESTPTLTEIGEMLQRDPELRLLIEGHTDATGDATANQALSERRAAAVRQYLIARYGVAEGRLEAQGFGPSRPAVSHDTPEGRQQNRRVELVRM